MTRRQSTVLVFFLTLFALVAFGANSVLCRLALGGRAIDALSFTAIRIGSGALALLVLNVGRQPRRFSKDGSWRGAFFLLLYALPFSLAYIQLNAGTGALLLFAAVQLTMIGRGLRLGERLLPFEWLGFAGAAAGVVYLVLPGLTAPNPMGAGLMIVAGVSWGAYSVMGKTAGDPASVTAGNFQRAALLVVPTAVLVRPWLSISFKGVLLAAASGVVASALGYVAWYGALHHLSVTRAALVQLAVPVIAAAGGVIFLGELITIRLISASAAILGSVVLATCRPARKPQSRRSLV